MLINAVEWTYVPQYWYIIIYIGLYIYIYIYIYITRSSLSNGYRTGNGVTCSVILILNIYETPDVEYMLKNTIYTSTVCHIIRPIRWRDEIILFIEQWQIEIALSKSDISASMYTIWFSPSSYVRRYLQPPTTSVSSVVSAAAALVSSTTACHPFAGILHSCTNSTARGQHNAARSNALATKLISEKKNDNRKRIY